jgi:hypothetical protein
LNDEPLLLNPEILEEDKFEAPKIEPQGEYVKSLDLINVKDEMAQFPKKFN